MDMNREEGIVKEPTRKRFLRRRSALITERDKSWLPHYKELSEFNSPRLGRFLTSNPNDGSKKNAKINRGTPTLALRTLASGMMAGLTSPARPWLTLAPPDLEMLKFQPVREYLEDVQRRMLHVYARSNLYTVLPRFYKEMGLFGTGAMSCLEDFETVVRFYPYTVGEYCIANDHRLRVGSFYRDYSQTVGVLVSKYGKNNVSKTVRNLWFQDKDDAWIPCVSAVEENDSRVLGMRDNKNMPFRAIQFELGSDEEMFLEFSGFEEFPIMASRWELSGTDVYGSGPGMDALGDVKQLQLEQKRKMQAIDKMSNPAMTAPSSMRTKHSTVLPGGITYIDETQSGQSFKPAYQVDPRINELKEDMRETEDIINRAFYVDLFLAITNSTRRQITAREIEERHEEKLLMLGPVLERLNDELLDPLVDRTFAIMNRNGLLPPSPPELEGVDLNVEYISILHQAQRAVGLGAQERFSGYVVNLAQTFPDAADKLDVDDSIDAYGEMVGVRASSIISTEDANKRRAARAAAQANQAQQAQAMEAASMGAKTAKDLSGASLEGDNALSRIAEGLPN